VGNAEEFGATVIARGGTIGGGVGRAKVRRASSTRRAASRTPAISNEVSSPAPANFAASALRSAAASGWRAGRKTGMTPVTVSSSSVASEGRARASTAKR